MAVEQKKAYDEYTLECKDVEFDQTVITSQDVEKKQFSTSYKTKDYNQTPGSLVVKEFEMDADDGTKLVSVTFDIIAPAKGADQNAIDPANTYKATATVWCLQSVKYDCFGERTWC